jgi:Zn-dependent M28 family amino/carboxypeptidase
MAHLDHIGIREPRPNDAANADRINNGAMDNATGIATLIEVARAFSRSGNRPRRPILIAAVTAEEKGLLGAGYLARHPVVGNGRVISVVNLDMPILTYDFRDVTAFGAEHSTMGPITARAASRMGVRLSPDPLPEEGLFTRSDHYNFVKEGIPSVFLMTGFANGGEREFRGFLATRYHSPGDDLSQPINWQAGAKFAQLNYLIAREIADGAEVPRWYRGSFFGDAFGGNQPRAERPTGAAAAH